MGKPRRLTGSAKDQFSQAEQLGDLSKVLDGQVEFGDPQDPSSNTSTALAGTTHNGRLVNLAGSWVELRVTTLDSNITCTHNLELSVPSATQPNVRWLVFGYQHDGTVANTTSTISCNYEDGTVAANSIQLRFYALTRTVDADHPLRVTLFFVPAVRGVAQS